MKTNPSSLGTAEAEAHPRFWSYLRTRDVDFFPTGALRWWILGLVVLGWTVQQFETFKTGPILPYILKDFRTDLVTWGYIQVGVAVATGVGGVLLGNLSDRVGRRPVVVYSVLLYAGVMVLGALAPTLGVFSIALFLGALLVSGMQPAVLAVTRDLSPQTGRALNFGWISVGYTFGALLSTWVAHETIPVWPGFRPQFWIGAVFAAAVVIILAIFYRDLSPRIRGQVLRNQLEAQRATAQKLGFANLEEAVRSGNGVYRSWRMWALSGAMLFWAITYVTVGSYVPLYITQYDGINVAGSAGLASAFWLVFTASVVVSGWLSDRIRLRKIVTVFGGVTTGVMFLVLAGLPRGTSIGVLAVVWALTGWFAGFIYPAWCALLSEDCEALSPWGVGRAFSLSTILLLIALVILSLGLPHVVGDGSGWPAWMVISAICCFMIGVMVAVGSKAAWFRPAAPEASEARSGA
jgi:MFS family permease